MKHLPDNNFKYSGLTVILDKKGRHDRTELCGGMAGGYFDSSLVAGGNPQIHRATVEIRTMEHIHEDFLPDTKCLLVLGPDALPFFKKDVSLDEQRGAPFTANGLNVIATYAPQDAYDRRDYFSGDGDEDEDDKDEGETAEGKTTHGVTQRKNWRFWMRQDIKKAVRLTTSAPNIPSPTYHHWPSINEVIHQLTTTKGRDFFFDIETNRNLEMTCFGFSFGLPDIWVVPMLQTHLVPQRYHYDDTYKLIRALAICLRDNRVVIHNSCFDLFVLAYRYGIPVVTTPYDTMLAHNRCYIEVEKSLGHVLSLHTDLPYHKNEGIFEPHNYVQTQQLYEYNGKDVLGLIMAMPGIEATAKRLKAEESVHQINRMVIPYLTMTLQGMRLDTGKIDEIVDYHKRWNSELLRILNITIGHEINPNSWQQVSKYLYEELGIKKPEKDPTAEKTLLQLLLKRNVPPVHAILKYRGNQKRISKASVKSKKGPSRFYYGCHCRETTVPRLTTSWRLAKTVTMRLGSSKLLRKWGDNVQNWEEMLRKCIRADEGKRLLQIDQSGAEALIVAYLCRPGQLRDLFLCNMNPHSYFAMKLYYVQFESALGYSLRDMLTMPVKELAKHPKWKEVAKKTKESDKWDSDRRYYFLAKQGNHSLNYDCKARAFRLNVLQKSDGAVALSLDDSQQIIDARAKLFPELPSWWNDIIVEAKKTNILRNLFGHPRVITGLIDEGMFKELYAFKPQSTVGQITNYAITEFQERIMANDDLLIQSGCDVLQNNHDSMLVQCWDDPKYYIPVAKEMQKHFNRRLMSPRGEEFYMKSEVKTGYDWGSLEELDFTATQHDTKPNYNDSKNITTATTAAEPRG